MLALLDEGAAVEGMQVEAAGWVAVKGAVEQGNNPRERGNPGLSCGGVWAFGCRCGGARWRSGGVLGAGPRKPAGAWRACVGLLPGTAGAPMRYGAGRTVPVGVLLLLGAGVAQGWSGSGRLARWQWPYNLP